MELRYLRYFVAVAEELNFRRAAGRVHVSAPTLSVQIKTLEGLLGAGLFTRDPTKVRLTVAGEALMPEARALLLQEKQLEAVTKEAARGAGGSLRIGTPGYFSYSFMPEALHAYLKRFPKVAVSLIELDPELEQPEALNNGTIQVGFVYGGFLRRMKNIEHFPVVDTKIKAAMGAAHPLAALRQVPLARMAEYPLLALQRFESHIKLMLGLYKKKKLKPVSVAKVDGLNACIALLAAGEGVSMLPDMRILSKAGQLKLRSIKDELPGLRLQLHAVWKKNETSQQVRDFVEALRQGGVRPC